MLEFCRVDASACLSLLRRIGAHALFAAVVVGGPASSLCADDAAAGSDPVEGRWLGTIGTAMERVEVGLEFARRPDGTLGLLLTQPISNYFDLPLAVAVDRDGARFDVEQIGLALELVEGRLVGTYPGPGSAAVFERVDALPGPPPIPELPAGPGPRWQLRLGGQVYASPVVAGGVVYVGTTAGVMNAVDAAAGKVLWVFAAGRPIFGAARVAGDAIYFVCDNGYLYKLGRADGEEVWRYDLGDARVPRILPHPYVFGWDWQAPTPVLADGVVYVGSGDGSFHAVDAASGARRWRFETGGRIRNGAAIDGDRVVVGSADHFVYALDRATGRELWKHDSGAEVDATPVIHAGKVLIGNRGDGLRALAAATGELLWLNSFWGSWVEATPVVVDGVIYMGSSDLRRVSAIDPTDGRVLWRTDVRGWSWGTPLVTAERIYAGAAGGLPYFLAHVASLTALDRASGEPLWRWPLVEVAGAHQWGIAGSPVAVADDLVVATIEGGLLAFPAK